MKLVRLAAAAGLLVAIGTAGVATAGSAAAAGPYPSGTISSAQINQTVFNTGDIISVTVNNVVPGPIVGQIFSAPTTFGRGTVVASADGKSTSGTVSGPVPAGYVGPHTVQVTSSGGDIFTFAITVNGAGNGTGGGNGGGGGLANTGAAVTGIGILGGILVAGGVFFVVAGRRRTASQTPSV